jgi:predicted GH43/DUF377 family glycosyl hydrolase
MLSKTDIRWLVVLSLMVVAVIAVSTMTAAETFTWDDEVDFEGGDWEATLWNPDEDGITLTGKESFWKYRGNPVVAEGSSGSWDDEGILEPCVVFAEGRYHIYYTGYDGTDHAIGLARSTDGKTFTKYGTSALITKGTSGTYDASGCRQPSVLFEDGEFKMWYTAINGATESIAYATSPDGLTWTKYSSNPVLSQPSSNWGSNEFGDPCVIRVDGQYVMYLSGSSSLNNKMVGIATSDDETSWSLYGSNPITSKAGSGALGQQEICDVAVIKDGPVFRMYFSGRNTASEKYRLGYGESFNGFTWKLSKGEFMKAGHTGTFDDTELQSPGVMAGSDGVIYMVYEGNDATDFELGAATYMPWLLRPNPPNDKILSLGSTYDATHIEDPCVFKSNVGVYNMFYGCYGGGSYPYSIARATATGPLGTWSKYASNPVLSPGTSGAWDDDRVTYPCVIFDRGVYRMWYSGYDGSNWKIGYATSSSGTAWVRYASNPVVTITAGGWDSNNVRDPWVVKVGNTFHMWYAGGSSVGGYHLGHATSTDGTTWTKDSANPVFAPEPENAWEKYHIFNPSVTWEDGRFVMYYTGYDSSKYKIGIAYSPDGSTWTRDPRNPFIDLGNATQFSDESVSMGSVFIEGGFNHIYYAGYGGTNWEAGYANFTTEEGTYTTPVLDASNMWPVAWGSLSWDADLPLGTYLRFQVATNQGGTVWRFVGPDGTRKTYFNDPGESILWSQSGKYMRVRAYMETDDLKVFEPVLRSITVTYATRPSAFPPTVILTSPNGGEDWMKTKDYPITWVAEGNLGDNAVSLDYSTNNGTTWTSITTNKPNTGFYKWTVPSTETSGALIRVTIIDVDNHIGVDISDATFAIDPPAPKAGTFQYPAEGTKLSPGTTTLSWTVEDPWGLAEAPLTLDLTTDGGHTWTTLAEGMPFSDGIQWEVPQLTTSSDTCRMRLSVRSWLGDVSIIESDEFSIDVVAPSVALEVPEGRYVEGEVATFIAQVDEDLGPVSVVLHIGSVDGERTLEMTSEDGKTLSVLYDPEPGDTEAWATVDDGVHQSSSRVHALEVEKASTAGGGAGSSIMVELMAATALAVLVTLVVLAVVIRRRG